MLQEPESETKADRKKDSSSDRQEPGKADERPSAPMDQDAALECVFVKPTLRIVLPRYRHHQRCDDCAGKRRCDQSFRPAAHDRVTILQTRPFGATAG
jgi:hypothetical protein